MSLPDLTIRKADLVWEELLRDLPVRRTGTKLPSSCPEKE